MHVLKRVRQVIGAVVGIVVRRRRLSVVVVMVLLLLVALAGEPVELTDTEYAVLYELAVHAPRTLTHTVLLQQVRSGSAKHGWCGSW